MVYVILGKGFEEIEAVAPVDIMRRAKIPVQYAGIGGKVVTGAHNINLLADITVEEMDLESMDMIVLPGGGDGVASIEDSAPAMAALEYALKNDKFVAAICAAPTILGKRGLLDGKKATCYPGMENQMGDADLQMDQTAIRDGKIITGRAPAAANDFGLLITQTLRDHAAAKAVMHFMVYEP